MRSCLADSLVMPDLIAQQNSHASAMIGVQEHRHAVTGLCCQEKPRTTKVNAFS